VLGYAVFSVFVDRATPAVVEAFGGVAGLPPELVRFGLAAVPWFVLVVTVLDRGRRRLVALGVCSRRDVERARRERRAPTEAAFLFSLAGVVAAWTFEAAVAAGVSLVRAAGTLDPSRVVSLELVAMVVRFVAFGGATRALDRQVAEGVRSLAAE
jgi:hypothetical protein